MNALAAVMAAMTAMAGGPAPAETDEIIAVEAPERSRTRNVLLAVAAAAAAVSVSDDSDEALEIYPLHFAPFAPEVKREGPQFRIGGVGLSFAAYKPKTGKDPLGLNNFRAESRSMGKVMPGYPQPAKVVVGLKVTF